ncbi:hypothetical protein [Bacteroides stercoris]|uniref:hypothetical protein n=3 Tax=Bacteroidales TaxID=171549 RepID=UPI00321A3D01
MNIYEIGQDFDNYKFFVFKEDDESNKGVWDYNGQSLINEWKGLSLELFRDKRKKKDKRSEEFDASCYFSGCLIVNKRTSLLLSEKLKGQIEVLPVNVDGNASGYYFINVLNTVDALNIESKSNEEILKMMRDNNGIFNKGNIGSYIIFRDSLFNNNYYCTDEFVDFVKQNSITVFTTDCYSISCM